MDRQERRPQQYQQQPQQPQRQQYQQQQQQQQQQRRDHQALSYGQERRPQPQPQTSTYAHPGQHHYRAVPPPPSLAPSPYRDRPHERARSPRATPPPPPPAAPPPPSFVPLLPLQPLQSQAPVDAAPALSDDVLASRITVTALAPLAGVARAKVQFAAQHLRDRDLVALAAGPLPACLQAAAAELATAAGAGAGAADVPRLLVDVHGEYNDARDAGGVALAEALATLQRTHRIAVRGLYLFNNALGDGAAHAVAALLRTQAGWCASVYMTEEVHLSHNRITEAGAQPLLDVCAALFPTRRQGGKAVPLWLRLEYNGIDVRACRIPPAHCLAEHRGRRRTDGTRERSADSCGVHYCRLAPAAPALHLPYFVLQRSSLRTLLASVRGGSVARLVAATAAAAAVHPPTAAAIALAVAEPLPLPAPRDADLAHAMPVDAAAAAAEVSIPVPPAPTVTVTTTDAPAPAPVPVPVPDAVLVAEALPPSPVSPPTPTPMSTTPVPEAAAMEIEEDGESTRPVTLIVPAQLLLVVVDTNAMVKLLQDGAGPFSLDTLVALAAAGQLTPGLKLVVLDTVQLELESLKGSPAQVASRAVHRFFRENDVRDRACQAGLLELLLRDEGEGRLYEEGRFRRDSRSVGLDRAQHNDNIISDVAHLLYTDLCAALGPEGVGCLMVLSDDAGLRRGARQWGIPALAVAEVEAACRARAPGSPLGAHTLKRALAASPPTSTGPASTLPSVSVSSSSPTTTMAAAWALPHEASVKAPRQDLLDLLAAAVQLVRAYRDGRTPAPLPSQADDVIARAERALEGRHRLLEVATPAPATAAPPPSSSSL
jgi:hypothetical protein